MTKPTLYSLPNCVQCKLSERELNKHGIEFEHESLLDDANLAAAKELGYQSAPVVVWGKEHWSGFRPDLIQQIAAAQQ